MEGQVSSLIEETQTLSLSELVICICTHIHVYINTKLWFVFIVCTNIYIYTWLSRISVSLNRTGDMPIQRRGLTTAKLVQTTSHEMPVMSKINDNVPSVVTSQSQELTPNGSILHKVAP